MKIIFFSNIELEIDKCLIKNFLLNLVTGRVGLTTPDKGVPDMTSIPEIDETGINHNLRVRYERDEIYVSNV